MSARDPGERGSVESCDALIVGGGPAGSTCAWKLSAAGRRVIVLDARAFPRDKTCAGWITPAVVQELRLDAAEYARTRTFQPVTGFRTGLIGGRAVETGYAEPVSFGIRRCEFDHYLLQRSGARLRLGERLGTIRRRGGDWIVNDSIITPLLVGAGGHACPVARLLGATAGGGEPVVAAQEIEFQMSDRQLDQCAVRASVPELYFCPDLLGYAWCFRKGNFLNIGLGREDHRRLSGHVAAFCDLMKAQGRIPRDTPDRFHGHAYTLYPRCARRLVDDGALLIGDAAGLAYARSGEGIRPAVESALLAADVILGSRGDFRRATLQPYAEGLARRFGPRSPRVGAPAPLPAFLAAKAAALLMTTRWFTRRVLIERWFLHADQAALTA